MPQIDYSVGFTTAEVEEILAAQKAELKRKKRIGTGKLFAPP